MLILERFQVDLNKFWELWWQIISANKKKNNNNNNNNNSCHSMTWAAPQVKIGYYRVPLGPSRLLAYILQVLPPDQVFAVWLCKKHDCNLRREEQLENSWHSSNENLFWNFLNAWPKSVQYNKAIIQGKWISYCAYSPFMCYYYPIVEAYC